MSSFIQSVTFIFVRHGETDWNVARRFQGHVDIPLNKNGIAQAICVAKKLSKSHPDITAIYSSDLLRAKETALYFAEEFALPIKTQSAFRESRGGMAEGMALVELEAKYIEKWKSLAIQYPDRRQRWNYTPVPGQETINEQIIRIKEAIVSIVKECSDKKVVVFTHGAILKSFIAYLKGVERDSVIALPNCSILEVLVTRCGEDSLFKLIKIEAEIEPVSEILSHGPLKSCLTI